MDRQASDVIAELDAQVAEFHEKLRIGIAELRQALVNSYVADNYLHPSEAVRAAEVAERRLERLLGRVQEYLESGQKKG